MTYSYSYSFAADLIEEHSKKLYAMIIEVCIPFDKKTSIRFKFKNSMNNSRILTAGRPLVIINLNKIVINIL
jgi:hypothetical protein